MTAEEEPGDRATGLDLGSMTDADLEAEVARRRRRRAAGRTPAGRTAAGATGALRDLAQAYANLELEPGSPLERVQARYRELLERYDPARFSGERQRTAETLRERLSQAYETLREALAPRG